MCIRDRDDAVTCPSGTCAVAVPRIPAAGGDVSPDYEYHQVVHWVSGRTTTLTSGGWDWGIMVILFDNYVSRPLYTVRCFHDTSMVISVYPMPSSIYCSSSLGIFRPDKETTVSYTHLVVYFNPDIRHAVPVAVHRAARGGLCRSRHGLQSAGCQFQRILPDGQRCALFRQLVLRAGGKTRAS